jgi:hypothetical protein
VPSKFSIRGIAMTTGTAVAAVAVAAGLNVTGVLGGLTSSAALVGTGQPTPTASVGHDTTAAFALTGDNASARTRHAWQRHRAAQTSNHAHKVRKARKERAAKAAAAARTAHVAASRSSTRSYSGNARAIARSMMASRYGWGASQFSCVNSLWNRESGWNVHAANPSGAYGIPQALPGSKMATNGGDWRDNPATQIAWGLSYVKSVYGSPCNAWSAFQSKGWY